MSAFDEARAARSGATSSTSLSSSRGTSAKGLSYQNADSSWTRACSTVEDELRKLTSGVASLRKLVETIGGVRDSADVRAKVSAAITRARDGVAAVGEALKSDVAPEAERADLSAKDKGARRLQQSRYTKDYKDAVAAFQEVATAAQERTRAHPVPKAGSVVEAGAGGRKLKAGGGRVGSKAEEDAMCVGLGGGGEGCARAASDATRASARWARRLRQCARAAAAHAHRAAHAPPLSRMRMQQVDFEESLVDERDEAITDIAQAITEVNETFRDLAQIVEDQGKDIETIELNVVSAEARTQEGVGHLESAEKLQKGCVWGSGARTMRCSS